MAASACDGGGYRAVNTAVDSNVLHKGLACVFAAGKDLVRKTKTMTNTQPWQARRLAKLWAACGLYPAEMNEGRVERQWNPVSIVAEGIA